MKKMSPQIFAAKQGSMLLLEFALEGYTVTYTVVVACGLSVVEAGTWTGKPWDEQ